MLAPLSVKLVNDNLGLAEVVARRYYLGQELIRDTELFSVACMELVRLTEGYDPELGEFKFSRLAFRSMKHAVIDCIRRNRRKKRTAQFESMSDQDWRRLPETAEPVEDMPVELLRTVLTSLGDDEQCRADRCLLEDVYIRRKKITAIAKQCKVSRVTVYNRLRRIFDRIKQRNCDLAESGSEIAI